MRHFHRTAVAAVSAAAVLALTACASNRYDPITAAATGAQPLHILRLHRTHTPRNSGVEAISRCFHNQSRGGGQTSGASAVLGAVVGGVLGNQVGKGSGRAAATAVGVIGGAVAAATRLRAATTPVTTPRAIASRSSSIRAATGPTT